MKLRTLLLVFLANALAACGPAPLPATDRPASVTATPFPSPTETPSPVVPTATSLPSPTPASVIDLPDGSAYTWVPVITGLQNPVDIQNAGDARLFVIEKAGRIRILRGGQLLPTPFLDITDRVGSDGSEQGLLGLAFHPRYAGNGRFYVNYTDRRGNTVIARYTAGSDPDLADPASEKVLLRVDQPFANHNGGGLAFGPDGYLYLGLGDGGSGGDPLGNAQSLDTLLGKILRLDVDAGEPYAIPTGNPYVSGGGQPEIWAYGLRNPWRFAFDPLTGDLYIGDVGQGSWEEIDFVPAGSPGGINFGWRAYEGFHKFDPFAADPPNMWMPVTEYGHGVSPGGCSVTGGVVYRGASLPEWNGVYLYGDYCSGDIWGLLHVIDGAQEQWISTRLFDTDFTVTSFGRDAAGEVYLANYADGGIYLLKRR
jgi:glucose/arabinose dehydrogenase